jgi:uncharacterized membrane protein
MKQQSVKSLVKSKVLREKIPFHVRLMRWGVRFNYGGLVMATLFFCISTLPSLLPRPSVYQGLISGISLAIGYGFGTSLSAALVWLLEREPKPLHKKYAWLCLAVVAPFLIILSLLLAGRWQDEVRSLVGEPTQRGQEIPVVLFVSLSIGLFLLIVARAIRRLNRFINNQLDRILPRRLSVAIGVTIVALVSFWVVSGLFVDFLISSANSFYSARNSSTPAGINQPTNSHRSGSSASLISWDTLGYQGKKFVAGGPNQSQLAAFSGNAPTEQIRVYVGMDSAKTAGERAQLAVEELKRTGAFDKSILVLATATGTGWLEPHSVDSIEYMYGGDTAIVAQQYSYLPSWISFLVDQQNATEAGQALYDAVYGEWYQMPRETRPKLISYGLSLGSFGGQTPFAGVNDLKYSIDGALFMGTPNETRLWQTITDNRDNGSYEWSPIYQRGRTVRFATTNQDITKSPQSWQYPRLLYVQHASDPVVWFNFDLLFEKPDWLSEPRGNDVSTATRWYPIVTFLQIGVDHFISASVPNGHGHNYSNKIVAAWAAVTNPPDWTPEKTARLQEIITLSAK